MESEKFGLRVALFIFVFSVFYSSLACAEEASTSAQTAKQLEKAEEREILMEQTKFATEDAGTAEPGDMEFKFTYLWRRAKKGWDKKWSLNRRGFRQELEPNLDFTIGLIRDLEAAVNMSYIVLKDKDYDHDETDDVDGPKSGHGFSDIPIAIKWRFYNNEKHRLSMAYVSGFTIPSGRSNDLSRLGPSQDFASFDEKLVFTKDIKRFAFTSDVGYSLPFGRKRGVERGPLTANVALGYQLFRFLQPEVELNYQHDFRKSNDDTNAFAVTGALLFPVHTRLLGIVGVQQTLFGDNVDRDFMLKSSLTYYY